MTDCSASPLDLDATLSSGQAFRWRRDESAIWWGTIESSAVALWQASGDPSAPLYWQTYPRLNERSIVEGYFRLDVPLEQLYARWIQAEPNIYRPTRVYRGLRILRQPPIECFFAFQCATCNTVVKIERSVQRLSERYGARIRLEHDSAAEVSQAGGEVPDLASAPANTTRAGDGVPSLASAAAARGPLHAFPTMAALAAADERELREDLWGYRAPRVISLAHHVQERGANWLPGLRGLPYTQAKQALVEFHGIGEKVADCICLFSLDKDEAVPVDTHVRQIACRSFLPELAGKSLTPRVYSAIAEAYRAKFGRFAGWAQQYMFVDATHSRR